MKKSSVIFISCLFPLLAISLDRSDPDVLAASGTKGNKQICVTFDDLPVARISDRIERLIITDKILSTLGEFGVSAAGFVIGDNIEDDPDILESWLASGHRLGNHTFSHPDLNEVPATMYIHDIEKGHKSIEGLLKKNKQKKRYFRYPYLHYGDNIKSRRTVADYLDNQGYTIAHVSIDTEDFVYNLQFEKIYQTADSLEMVQLGHEYIDHIMEQLDAAEKLSDEILGRPIRHILLLHMNRLNSYFLGDLLSEITRSGYGFVSFDQALADPVYGMTDSYIGPKGLSILDRLAETDPDMLPAREED